MESAIAAHTSLFRETSLKDVMSKANFYRIPIKTPSHPASHQRPRSPADEQRAQGHDASEWRPAYHPAPQLRRSRRSWLRRMALAKARETK
jgi:hypothetical protein